MVRLRVWSLLLVWSLELGAWNFQTRGQTAAPPTQDPLMSLMLSQPKIDVGAPVTAIAWFDPPVVGPGQLSFYRVTFNALEESIEWNPAIAAPPGLELKAGARGQVLQPVGVTIEPRTSFNYRARPPAAGDLTVPQFSVTVSGKPIVVPAAGLRVVQGVAAPAPLQPVLEIPVPNLFVGQSAKVRVLMPSSAAGGPQVLFQVELSGDGFIVDKGAMRQSVENTVRGGSNFPTFIHETMFTPVTEGKLIAFAQGYCAVPVTPGVVVTNGRPAVPAAPAQYVLLESEPVELSVKPLPKKGELPGFTGAIGAFTVDPPKLATNLLKVGDPVKLSVAVRSATGFARLVAPPAPQVREWQVLAETAEGEPTRLLQAQGFASFEYTLIPMTEEAQSTPAIPFSCFDPARGAYVDLTIPPLPVTVRPGRAAADWQAILQESATTGEAEETLKLSGLALAPGRYAASLAPLQSQSWFPLVQLAPAAAFIGLWGWDRRRQFLEQHPDILRRRRARRALRREWRAVHRAARAGDVPRFAAAAVSALRVACAPHFPAEPRALVGGDVLQLLGSSEGTNGSAVVAVRRLFSAADAASFAVGAESPADLLVLEPELEQILQRLEERL